MPNNDGPYIDATDGLDNWGRCRDVFFDGDRVDSGRICERIIEVCEDAENIPGGREPEKLVVQAKMVQNWMNMRLEDNWFVFRDGVFEGEGHFIDFFKRLYEKNSRFKDIIQEKYKPPNVKPYMDKGWDEVIAMGEEDEEEEVDEGGDEMKRYGKLEDIGVVDSSDGLRLKEDKLRGTMVLFSNEVDEIRHSNPEVNLDGIKQSYQRWMLNKIGEPWTRFLVDFRGETNLYEHIEYLWENHDGFRNSVEGKWEHSPQELEGNGSRETRKESNGSLDIDDWSDKLGVTESPGITKEEEDEGGVGDVIHVDGSEVINGDSTDVVPRIEDNSIHALVTDPPYGQDYDSRGEEHDVIEGDDDLEQALGMTEEVLKKARMCLKKGSPIVVFCGKTNLPGVIKMVDRWYKFLDINVWDKGYVGTSQIGGTPIKWRPKHEYAVLGVHGSPRHENENRHDGNVWDFQRLSGHNMNHPTEKPVELLDYIIRSLTIEDEYVLDPFAGSGSTLLAARRSGRNYIGVEYDEQYYNHIVNERLSQNTLEAF